MRLRAITITFMVLSLLISSCSQKPSSDESEWHGTVGEGEVRAELGSVSVVFPDGVAPAGTDATVRILEPDAEVTAENTTSMSDAVEVILEDDLQPQVPVTINIPVTTSAASLSTIAESYLLLGSSTSADHSEGFFTGTLDPKSGTFSMTVDHLSKFKILGVDLDKILGEVRTSIMQGIGLEFPAPGCVGASAEISGTTYEADSSDTAYICLEGDGDSLVVSVYPAIAMPYLVSSSPETTGVTAASEVGIGTAGIIAFARQLDLIDSQNKTGLFPGAKATYTFDGTPESVNLNLDQYPVLLLMSILATTLDVLGVTAIDALDGLQCLADVAESNSRLNDGMTGEYVGAFTKSFFSCAGTVGNLSPFGTVLLAILGSAPAFLVTSVVGIVNEFSGQAHQEIDLIVTPPEPEESESLQGSDFLNATLPPNVCTTSRGGWPHSSSIQLVDGQGSARTASGAFDGAGVIKSAVLGEADIDGDGKLEVIMSMWCAGSEPENCCAGRSSVAQTIAAFSTGDAPVLKQVGSSLMGGQSGPADRQISSAELSGNTVITSEYIVYPEMYTSGEVGGDPDQKVSVEYTFSGGDWVASLP